VDADGLQFLAPGIRDRRFAAVGQHDRRAIGRMQREQLEARRDLLDRDDAQRIVIAGGDERFSLAAGDVPVTLAGVGQTFTVHFDDAGATRDSTYEALLTFQGADGKQYVAIVSSGVSVFALP